MPLKLDKINPKFRQLVDLLFNSDRMDIDLFNFKIYLKSSYEDNLKYLLDRFKRCSNIAWENGSQFWNNRLSYLLSLEIKSLSKDIEAILEKAMFSSMRLKINININYNIEFLQYVELCKVKHSRGEKLAAIKNNLLNMTSHVKLDYLIKIIGEFIPFVFSDMNEYCQHLVNKITNSARNLDLLVALDKVGHRYDRDAIIKLCKDLCSTSKPHDKNIYAFFALINNKEILSTFKQGYIPAYRVNIIDMIEICDYQMIDEFHLRNIKNLIELDQSLIDDIINLYCDKIYRRYTSHKRSNINKLIRLIKDVDKISEKKILTYLSKNNHMNDLNYLIKEFPNLKKFSAFV